MNTVSADRPHKHARLVQILDQKGADSVLLTQSENLAWYLDGARTSVPVAGPPVFAAEVHRDGRVQITALANEIDRLMAEEIAGAEARAVDWFAPLDDMPPATLRDSTVPDLFRTARASLLPVERTRYAHLGVDAAAAMTQVLRTATPDMTEAHLAGALADAVTARGAEVTVLLVAGARRSDVQHPLPTAERLGDRAMAVITAKRHGLHASVTRWVQFTRSAGHTARETAIARVEADVLNATRPGRDLDAVLADCAESYRRHGFGTEQHPAWLRHHQGGPTGYLGRDPKAFPGSRTVVVAGGAFAWNPSAPGVKAEDTIIIDGDGASTVLTHDPHWPGHTVDGRVRPLTLDLS